MRLHDLGQPENPAQFVGGRRDLHRQQRVTGFRGSDQMAHREDSANARHERWHLGKRPAFAEFFEAAELRDVKLRVVHLALLVQVQRDFRVALDAGHRVDDDGFAGQCGSNSFVGRPNGTSSIVPTLSQDYRSGLSSVAPPRLNCRLARRPLSASFLCSASELSSLAAYAPNRVFELSSGWRPSTNSVRT